LDTRRLALFSFRQVHDFPQDAVMASDSAQCKRICTQSAKRHPRVQRGAARISKRKRGKFMTKHLVLSALLISAVWGQNAPPLPSGAPQQSPATAAQGRGKTQAAPVTAGSPEDAEIQRLQEERKRLLKQQEIEKLRKENERLKGAEGQEGAQTPPPKPLSPEDAELQRLEAERKRLLKEQEIENLRKQNEALKAPVQPGPPQAPPPAQVLAPCVAAPAKESGMMASLRRHLERTLQTQAGKADAKIGKGSNGNVDVGLQDSTTAAINEANQPKPCGPAAKGQGANR
jgi:hypothetical protein